MTDPDKKLKKLRKILDDDRVKDLEALDETALRSKIVECEISLHDIRKALDADEDLARQKQELKNASEPYRESKRAQQAIIEYSTHLLEMMGKA